MADPELLAACMAKHAGRVALQLYATWLSDQYRPTENLESPCKIWCGEVPMNHTQLSVMPLSLLLCVSMCCPMLPRLGQCDELIMLPCDIRYSYQNAPPFPSKASQSNWGT